MRSGNLKGRFVALVATAAVVVGACSSGASTTPTGAASQAAGASGAQLSGSITFLEKWPDPNYAPYFQQVVKAYTAAHPNVKIDLQAVGDQPIKDKLRVLAASKQMPDIYFSWAGDFTKKFVRGGLAADLSQYLKGTDWGNSFVPAALQAFTYDGKTYGVPIDLDAKFFVYNTKIFQDNGLSVPKTMADLLSTCDTLKSKGIQPIAFGNQYGWPAIHYMTQLNAYTVAPATLAQDYEPATGAFTDPGYKQALTTLQDLNSHCLTQKANGLSHESAQATFMSGKAAMQYVESVEFPVFTAAQKAPDTIVNNWDFFKMPPIDGAAGDPKVLEGAPDGFLVNPNSQHMDIVIDFLKYLTNVDNAKLLLKMNGWLSPVKGSATADNAFPQLIRVLDEINNASSMAIWLDTVTNINVANAYLNGVQALLDGSKSADQVIADVQAGAAKAKTDSGS
ncbi:MAG TPA: extracellular solute-binding protein [Candidatus Limnocylindrales bacterium]